MTIQSYQDLIVWQEAVKLAADIENVATALPAHERYGLTAQIRRAANSIPANIAEGWARPTRVYINHLSIALGSEAELKTHLLLAVKMKLVTQAQAEPLLASASQVGRMLRGLQKSLHIHLRRTQGP